MAWSLKQADIVKISDKGIHFLWGISPEAGAQKRLNEYGASLVYATLSPKGRYSAARTNAVTMASPAFQTSRKCFFGFDA